MKNIEVYNTLNIDKDSSSIVATFTQEDDAVMEFKLFKDGQEIVLKDQTISLGAERKDGAVIEQDDGFLIKENNVLNIALKKNIIQVVGVVKIQLYLKDKSGEMASNTFNIRVNKKLLGAENVEATNDIKSLNTLVLELKNNTNKLIDDTKSKADKLLNGLQETGDNLSSTVKAKTDKIIEDTKAEVNNIKKDYEGLKKVVIDENIGIKLQKDVTELQNGLKSNQSLSYEGSSIAANNTLEGRTEGMRIVGRALVNLAAKKDFFISEDNSKATYSWSNMKNLYKAGIYTIKNITGKILVWNIHKIDNDNWVKAITVNSSSTITLEENQYIRNIQALSSNGFIIDDSIEKILSENVIILDNNQVDVIDSIKYFEGLKSFGEAEQEGDKYKISILSTGRNLINDSEKNNVEIVFADGTEHVNNKVVTTGFTPFFKNTSNLTGKVTIKNIEFNPTFRWYDKDKKYIGGDNLNNIPSNAKFVRMRVLDSVNPINPSDVKFMLVDNKDNTTYEPYEENKKDILIKEPLRSKGDICDLLYEDNGQVKIDRYISVRKYQEGDENNKEVITDKINTVYILDKPTTEIVENCVDIDLDTFEEKTYFSIENSLPGTLDFKVPSNIGSVVQNMAKEVNNIWDVINNLLVPSILDVNKKVALATIKNNLK